MLDELAKANDAALTELERTEKPKVAILNSSELVHFASILKSPATLSFLLRAAESPLAAKYFPRAGIWNGYSAALVNLHREDIRPMAVPQPKGHEKYFVPYIELMTAADNTQLDAARLAIAASFEVRNRDRRFTDWLGLDGDGNRPVRWDLRLYAIEASRTKQQA